MSEEGKVVNTKVLLILLASVLLSSTAQIVLKTGMSQTDVALAVESGSHLDAALAVFLSWWIITGLALYFSAAVVWLFALARIQVSMAYPFVGLGFILTMLMGKFLMGDAVSAARLAGTLLISVGVVLVAWR